ncbi:MAG: hypothetical protein HGA80_02230 [Candidatus Omnitrophica bacterium]|nr:hypothetical protein [Candidatus Omnitrophota bacterium]
MNSGGYLRAMVIGGMGACVMCMAMPAFAINDGGPSAFILPQYSRQVSLDFKDADLKDVLKALSAQIGVNFLIADGVPKKNITVYLEKVPVEEALDMIITTQNLAYRFDDNVNTIIVTPKPKDEDMLETRIYQLQHATVNSSPLNSTLDLAAASSAIGGSSSSSSGSSSGSSSSSSSSSGGSGSANTTGILEALKTVLTSKGKVEQDARTNSLIVTDMPKQFAIVEKTIARLDVPVPQILIEVEMLDVSKNTLDSLGLKFTADNVLTVDSSNLDFSSSKLSRYAHLEGFFRKGSVTSAMQAVLSLVRSDGTTKTLARPRLLTLDNQRAQIKIATDEVIGIKHNVTGTTGENTTDEAERLETGVIFTVTPQANLLSGEITLAIVPKVIDSGLTSVLGNYKNPEERSVNALIKVKDGQTVIIGGLLRQQKDLTISKLPILGDVPLLGLAFRHKREEVLTRDLLIVLTPHILGVNDIPQGQFHSVDGSAGFKREQSFSSAREAAISDELNRVSSSAGE